MKIRVEGTRDEIPDVVDVLREVLDVQEVSGWPTARLGDPVGPLDPATGSHVHRWNHLRQDGRALMSRRQIADEVYRFITAYHHEVELWAYFGAYDHVAVAQLFGRLVDLPDGMPMWSHELMQLWHQAGRPDKPPLPADAHNALADARWCRQLWQTCERVRTGSQVSR